ncbi:thioredoxin TrxA [Acetobacter thailandicus]|uniref:thioredoxin TrxA n=1 Tax=Acetobacter thailandicus TaxID=1502842 RepID=UPI001BAC14F2|nr:thioredoxin TrxA [Acetobacter thailandicus]MBS0960678.1 thioredoxin TrxA [Acetobacter thailandicus]
MSEHTIAVNDSDFATNVLGASGLVLVDFWAEWCGPCKMIGPALEEIGKEYAGKVTVAKINIDENPETPTKHSVRSIPTLMLVRDGKVIDTKVGALPKSQLKAWVEGAL